MAHYQVYTLEWEFIGEGKSEEIGVITCSFHKKLEITGWFKSVFDVKDHRDTQSYWKLIWWLVSFRVPRNIFALRTLWNIYLKKND